MNSTEYRKYHESFMQNNHGSTALHTFLSVYLTVQCALYCVIKNRSYSSKQYLKEYFIIVLPTILAHTIFSNYIYELNLFVALLLLYEILTKVQFKSVEEAFRYKTKLENSKIQSITCLRGLTYLITVICILAVDFRDFPRYLAKTERYGYSLMDTGVGLFILMSGLVHKDFTKNNYISVITSNTKVVCILLILGVTRYLSVKQLDYRSHVTEYGVHWNFFITLAVCKFLSSFLLLLSSHSFILCIIVISIHEFLLYNNLEAWVFSHTSRNSLVDANKEGLSSTLGYVALYLFAVKLKKVLMNKYDNRLYVFGKLVMTSVALIVCSFVINLYRPTSRTLANMGYGTYLSGITVFVLSIMYFLETSIKYKRFNTPLILIDINDNGLLFFLIANVITGVVNISVRTLLVPTITALLILNFYMILSIGAIVYLNKKGIKL